MQIQGKSIRAVTKLLAASKGCKEVKLIHKVTTELKNSLLSIGFDADPKVGDFLIPKPVGKCSGLMILDTNLGGKIHLTEVFNDNEKKDIQS
jgi:hypothetical protein